jgi:CRP-like cAMP-binding protein
MERHGFIDERLADTSLFHGLTKHQLRTVTSLTTCMDLEPGAVITKEGHPGAQFVLVLDGSVAVSTRDRVVTTRGAGEFLGEISLLTGCMQTATALSTTRVGVAVVSKPDFWSLLGGLPAVGDELRSTMLDRLAELHCARVEVSVA